MSSLDTNIGNIPTTGRIDYESEIARLRKEMNAVILAHYYVDEDIQDLADFVGDSLELARKAVDTDAEVIVFCGVRFMAEGAYILNPDKLVLIPDMKAGCSLEDSCQPDAFAAFKARYPDHTVVSYINCSAEIKALSDIIVTSSNAESIVNQLPEDEKIIFAPDKYLGAYINKKTGRDMVLWDGTCIVHERFSEKELINLRTRYPNAHTIAHPECPETLLRYAEHVGSTSSLINFTKERAGNEFIVLTEPGILHEMKKRSTGSTFYDVPGITDGACVSCNQCPYMQLNTIESLYSCMKDRAPALTLSADLVEKARKPLARMLEMSRHIGQ